MARIDRRRLLKFSGAGAVAAGSRRHRRHSGLGRAPAYAQATSLHWLRWADFVPASDQLLKDKIAPQCEKALGIKLNIETINANDLQARVTSAIQSGTGPDIIMLLGNWPQLYADSVVDVSDVAEEIGKAQGGYYDIATDRRHGRRANGSACRGRSAAGSSPIANRGWRKSAAEKFPETWDEFRAMPARSSRPRAIPIGQTAGHTFGDAPGWWYPYLWSWGGKEVAADGKTVVLNSKETIESVKFAVPLVEGDDGRRRACLGRYQQQPRLPVRHASAPPTTAPRSISRPRRSPTPT